MFSLKPLADAARKQLEKNKVQPSTDPVMQPVQSSAIKQMGYNPHHKLLHLEFTGGGKYAFKGVGPRTFYNFTKAESKGAHFRQYIMDRYDSERLDKVHLNDVIAASRPHIKGSLFKDSRAKKTILQVTKKKSLTELDQKDLRMALRHFKNLSKPVAKTPDSIQSVFLSPNSAAQRSAK